jgi:pimeloyl-ACP methyl ester carboxylesterase
MRPTRKSNVYEHVVSVRGADLFVRERGDGYPLVMVNGLGANLDMWGATEERLAKTSRVIVFDAPGTGRSGTPALPLSIPSIAKLIAKALDELGYGKVDVLGYSLGGVMAQQFAHDFPDRTRRLALVATACGWGSVPGEVSALALLAMPLRFYSRALYMRTNHLLGDPDEELDRRLASQLEARLRHPPSLLGYAYQIWAGMTWSSLPWIHKVKAPTLVIGGASDRLVPGANSIQLARLLPNSRLHMLNGENHLLLFDPESGVHPLISDYFASPRLEKSRTWASGTNVDDDEMLDEAIRNATGGQPFRAMSGGFRWLVGRTSGPALNGGSPNGASPNGASRNGSSHS